MTTTNWRMFQGHRTPGEAIAMLPPPPPWRPFRTQVVARERIIPPDDELPPAMQHRARTFQSTPLVVDIVNAALCLRRPILVTGKPGSGKSSLVDAVAWELRLGEPLRWAVTSRTTLRDGLYVYDAVGRLQDQQRRQPGLVSRLRGSPSELDADEVQGLSRYLQLGPLGTALLPSTRPRALLIDEIDKADLDLPNDLLNVLEEGEFEIPELARLGGAAPTLEVRPHRGRAGETYPVTDGLVRMKQFPFVVFTSNGERDFPPAFLRRCLRLDMPDPCADPERLAQIVDAHLGVYLDPAERDQVHDRIVEFVGRAKTESLATDQLLNAIFLVAGRHGVAEEEKNALVRNVTRALG